MTLPFASAVASMPHQGPPIAISKFLDTRKAQLDFILEQQEERNRKLTQMLYA